MEARTCVFCRGSVAKKGDGEHVYPSWWLDMWEGPFYAQVGDEYVCRRAKDGGERFAAPNLPPMKLREVCGSWEGSENCNGRLAQLFENPGKPAVEALWRSQSVLVREQVAAFAAWWVKTLLLANHPWTVHTFPRLERIREERGQERRQLQGQQQAERERSYPAAPGTDRPLLPILNGPALFPPDLSLWLAVGDETDGQHALAEHRLIDLPTIYYGNQPSGRGTAMGAGPSLLHSSQRVLLTLLHHPYATVAHPFERAGLAVRLWPNPPGRLDITALPVLNNTGIRQFEHQFAQACGHEIIRGESEEPLLLHSCPGPLSVFPWPYCGCTG